MFWQRKATLKEQKSKIHAVMGIICLAVTLFLSGAILPAGALSHPAGKVSLTYNKSADTLTVTIKHSSAKLNWHYIKIVSVEKNKEKVMDSNYENQPASEFAYTYDIAASSGDTITVTTTCSLYGDTATHITIP